MHVGLLVSPFVSSILLQSSIRIRPSTFILHAQIRAHLAYLIVSKKHFLSLSLIKAAISDCVQRPSKSESAPHHAPLLQHSCVGGSLHRHGSSTAQHSLRQQSHSRLSIQHQRHRIFQHDGSPFQGGGYSSRRLVRVTHDSEQKSIRPFFLLVEARRLE